MTNKLKVKHPMYLIQDCVNKQLEQFRSDDDVAPTLTDDHAKDIMMEFVTLREIREVNGYDMANDFMDTYYNNFGEFDVTVNVDSDELEEGERTKFLINLIKRRNS